MVGLNLPAVDAPYKPTTVPTNEPRMNVDLLVLFVNLRGVASIDEHCKDIRFEDLLALSPGVPLLGLSYTWFFIKRIFR